MMSFMVRTVTVLLKDLLHKKYRVTQKTGTFEKPNKN
jgi:hypothetical protein